MTEVCGAELLKSVDNIKYVDKKIAFIRYFHCKFPILVRIRKRNKNEKRTYNHFIV